MPCTCFASQNQEGGVDVPPPVLSRTFQLLSEAEVEHDQVKKIRDTPFPLPFAQVCSMLLLFWCLSFPVILCVYVNNLALGCSIAFVGVLSFFSINGISSEMEDPFDDRPNDLPLDFFVDEYRQTHSLTHSLTIQNTLLKYPEKTEIYHTF
eukprot:COSAG05_NODE_3400_length_2085_cov_3.351964_2_plen_151_part_00